MYAGKAQWLELWLQHAEAMGEVSALHQKTGCVEHCEENAIS